MKNFKPLLISDLNSQIKSFTFVVMIPVALVLSFLVTNLQMTSYKDRTQVYLEQQKQSNERLDNAHFYSQFEVDVFMPPSLLSVYAKGLDESIGNKITVSVIEMPELSNTSQRSNAFIRIFNNIDISGIVKILSIFIVLLAACPIAMDRERQTGKLIFANSVGQFEYYLSKYTTLMIIISMVTVIVFIIPVAWMTFDTKITLALSNVGSILLMMISSILYLSAFALVSLAISAMSSKVSIATISSLIVWVVLVFVYPFTVNSMIDRLVKMPSASAINEEISQIDNETHKEMLQFGENHAKQINSFCGMTISQSAIIATCNVTTKDCFESYKFVNEFTLPKWWNRNDQVYALKESQRKKQLHKKKLYEQFTFFIPDNIYQNVCEQIAGTDYEFRERRFMDAARNYRSILMDYIQSKNGFGYTFFTQMPELEMRDTYDDYSQSVMDRYCDGLDKIFTAEVPRFIFSYQTETVSIWMVLLVLLNAVLIGLSVHFSKSVSFK